MSGISGIVGGSDDINGDWSMSMVEKLCHRGPERQTTYSQGKIMLGLNRWEMPDSQLPPLTSWNKTVIALDGYISNHEDLMCQVNVTEVDNQELTVLRLYEKYGPEMLNMLRGAFALAIVDNDELLVARDPLGVKPLYYSFEEGCFYFASEMKALTAVIANVEEFPPGYYFHSRNGWHKYRQQFTREKYLDMAPEEIQERIVELLKRGVRNCIPEDSASLGLLLSGGLDSSLIAALAVETNGAPLPSFSVGVEGSNDLARAREVADFIGTKHYEYVFDESDVNEALADTIYHLESFDMALVSGSLGNFLVSRMAAEQGIKVLLSGEGADELFAGYAYMKKFSQPEEVQDALDYLVNKMHKFGCQRIDRMNTAHSLEVRVPFLEQDLIEFSSGIHPRWKLYGEEKTEKWILRKAFADQGYLPEDIIWRTKEPFGRGCNSDNFLTELADQWVSSKEYNSRQNKDNGSLIRSKEEYYYYRIFKEFYPQKAVEEIMGRWPESFVC